MIYYTELQTDVENWWKHMDNPMTVLEGLNDLKIGDFTFRPWGDKHHYNMKTKCTSTYLRTFQSTEPVENIKLFSSNKNLAIGLISIEKNKIL